MTCRTYIHTVHVHVCTVHMGTEDFCEFYQIKMKKNFESHVPFNSLEIFLLFGKFHQPSKFDQNTKTQPHTQQHQTHSVIIVKVYCAD
jgi:hypothetical protein